MSDAQTGTLVLKDTAGNYFLVPQETLEQGRVPAEHTAEIEQAIAAAQGGAGGNDVEGYLALFAVAFVVGFTATRAIMKNREQADMSTGQMIQGMVDQARGAAVRPPV
ncbi:MAG: hypothetical protein ACRDJE_11170 [Dehalococcoidia bacterium]